MYCLQDLQMSWPVKVSLMYCLQDLQKRWTDKVGLIYCLQDLQVRWTVKVALMYCLQDLQMRWTVKVGLMYCLQDLQVRWTVKVGLMYCLQDLQVRRPVKVGLMYCLQDLQMRWPVKVRLMYCLQDLQVRWPVKVGLMYCLQDLQVRWPVKAVWRERSVLTGFNISAVTKLQVRLIAVRKCHITPAEQKQTAMIFLYCTFPVRLPVNCNWWTNLSCDCNERFCCCVATAAQIALSSDWDWARFVLKQGIQRPCQPTLQQDTVPPAFIPSTPWLLPAQLLLPVC